MDKYEEIYEDIGFKPVKYGKGIQVGLSTETVSLDELLERLNNKIQNLEKMNLKYKKTLESIKTLKKLSSVQKVVEITL